MRNLRSVTPPASFTHRAEAICMASLNDIVRGFSSAPRTPAGRCHFASRSRATRSIVFGSGVTSVASGADISGQFVQSGEPSGNEHRWLELSEEHAADPYATFRNGSLGQNIIDVLFGFARGAARVPQQDVCVEEMMAAIGLTRTRIRLGKWVHLTFHWSLAMAASRAERVDKKQPAAILLTRAPPQPFLSRLQSIRHELG